MDKEKLGTRIITVPKKVWAWLGLIDVQGDDLTPEEKADLARVIAAEKNQNTGQAEGENNATQAGRDKWRENIKAPKEKEKDEPTRAGQKVR